MTTKIIAVASMALCALLALSCLSAGRARDAAPSRAPELKEGYARIRYQRRDGSTKATGSGSSKDVAVPSETSGVGRTPRRLRGRGRAGRLAGREPP
jgi:hypothetical protein